MNAKHDATAAMLVRARLFLNTHPEVVGAVAHSTTRQLLDASIESIQQAAADQAGCTVRHRAATRTRRALLRAVLVEHMRPISRIARQELGEVRDSAVFWMPSRKACCVVDEVCAAAMRMAGAAEAFEAAFIDAGLPLDFIEQLRRAAKAAATAHVDQGVERADGMRATARIADSIRVGVEAVRVLDVLLAPGMGPSELATWRGVIRLAPPIRPAPPIAATCEAGSPFNPILP